MMIDLLHDFWRPVMKSMEKYVHKKARSGNGCKVLDNLTVSLLLCWHTSHLATKVRMPFFMLVQNKE